MLIKFREVTRVMEWWEYKITLFLFVGLLIILEHGNQVYISSVFYLFILLAAIVNGSIFVSLINDFTDLEDDKKAGKNNRLYGYSKTNSILLILITLAIGILFCLFLLPNYLAICLYIGAYLSFTFYSVPPIRLKNRGIFGVLADSLGAHVFPTLFIWAGMNHYTGSNIDWAILAVIAVWSISFGLRGIMNHQFQDLIHDKATFTKTFLTKLNASQVELAEKLLITLEIVSFILILFIYEIYILMILLGLYFIYAWLVQTYLHVVSVIIKTPENSDWQFFMSSFYQTVVPISLIILLAELDFYLIFLLPLYLFFFHYDIKRNAGYVIALSRLILKKIKFI